MQTTCQLQVIFATLGHKKKIFTLPLHTSYDVFKHIVHQEAAKHSSLSMHDLCVHPYYFYLDDESEWVRFSSQQEWHDFLQQAQIQNLLSVAVSFGSINSSVPAVTLEQSMISNNASSTTTTVMPSPTTPVNEQQLSMMMCIFKSKIVIKDRWYRMKQYEKCFIGSEAVDLLLQEFSLASRDAAVQLGRLFMERGLFHHVLFAHCFKDRFLFYRLNSKMNGSWSDNKQIMPDKILSADMLLTKTVPSVTSIMELLQIVPTNLNENVQLVQNCHPPVFVNPKKEDSFAYNIVIIGAGVVYVFSLF